MKGEGTLEPGTAVSLPDSDLTRHMDNVQLATSAASEAIRQRYFPTNAAPSWVRENS